MGEKTLCLTSGQLHIQSNGATEYGGGPRAGTGGLIQSNTYTKYPRYRDRYNRKSTKAPYIRSCEIKHDVETRHSDNFLYIGKTDHDLDHVDHLDLVDPNLPL